MLSIRLYAGQVAVEKLVVGADFDYLKTLCNQKRAEFPKLIEFAEAVENGRDILGGVVSGDSEIVIHKDSPF